MIAKGNSKFVKINAFDGGRLILYVILIFHDLLSKFKNYNNQRRQTGYNGKDWSIITEALSERSADGFNVNNVPGLDGHIVLHVTVKGAQICDENTDCVSPYLYCYDGLCAGACL